MLRFDGVGLAFLGVHKTNREDHRIATRWFTFLYMPIFPISRHEIRPFSQVNRMGRSQFSYEVVQNLKLNAGEILSTYFFGWIVFPLIILGPTVALLSMATPEAQKMFTLPHQTQMPFFIAGLTYGCIAVWKAMNWGEDRWFK